MPVMQYLGLTQHAFLDAANAFYCALGTKIAYTANTKKHKVIE